MVACFSATSATVKSVFSRVRTLLSQVQDRQSAQTTRALVCLCDWSQHGLVKDSDVTAVAMMSDVDDRNEVDLEYGWDVITRK